MVLSFHVALHVHFTYVMLLVTLQMFVNHALYKNLCEWIFHLLLLLLYVVITS